MYKEILNDNQLALLPTMSSFKREYYLVGGTAIALYLGHRRSIDFDLFKYGRIYPKRTLDKLSASGFPFHITRRVEEQINLIINEVKVTFFQYPFQIEPVNHFEDCFRLPSLLQLSAMKAYALGRRSKWKDYVDLYFLLNNEFSISEISSCATQLYGDLFSEKLFRSQLCFFDDIDYSESVDFIIPSPPSEETIKKSLTAIAVQGV